MSFKKDFEEEMGETLEEMPQLNEINYNCTKCSSPIEILSLNEKECSIEFKCINNNHELKMAIKDYINKMKSFNDKNINNDICDIHNKKFECYCTDCNKHLCKECLMTREHIDHSKYNIIEYQPNKKELNIIENIIKYYEDKIRILENEGLNKTKVLNNKLKKYKIKLNKKRELKLEENENKMEKELKIKYNNYIKESNNIKIKYENEKKSCKDKYMKSVNEIKSKYKTKNGYDDIQYKIDMENLNKKYEKIIKKFNFYKKIENMNQIRRLNEIIFNTYNMYNNNYFNSININAILINNYKTKIYFNDGLIDIYKNINKIKNVKEKQKEKVNKKINNNELREKNKKKVINVKKIFENKKCAFIIPLIFSFIDEKVKLETVKYNKNLQNKININLNNYKLFSNKYIVYESKGKGKEYDYDGDLRYEGEYLNGKRHGKGKEYNYNGELIYEGEYLKGKRHGKGKEKEYYGNILYDGEYFDKKNC